MARRRGAAGRGAAMNGQWIDDDWNLALDQDPAEARRAWATLATPHPEDNDQNTTPAGQDRGQQP
jgi:hypothetical protein